MAMAVKGHAMSVRQTLKFYESGGFVTHDFSKGLLLAAAELDSVWQKGLRELQGLPQDETTRQYIAVLQNAYGH